MDRAVSGCFDERTAGYRTVVEERFEGDDLDPSLWLPFYLPHWVGRAASRAHYRVGNGRLELFIGPDQAPWSPELEGDLRVSSLQTGCFAGPLGSTVGQHRLKDAQRVVEEQPTLRLLTPTFGAVELRSRWEPVPDQMVALWMIGFEDEPERSAEICVCEIFGSEAGPDHALFGTGVHPFGDPRIVDDFEKISADIDVGDWHTYAAIWTPDDVTFFIDGAPTKLVAQSPHYPMQLMLDIWDFAPPTPDRPISPFQVDRVRVMQSST